MRHESHARAGRASTLQPQRHSTATARRTVLAGMAGGLSFGVATFLTFVLVGSGLDHRSGPLFDRTLQNPKVIAVWTQLEPLPLFVTRPQLMLLGYVVFGIAHALLFRSVARAWPGGVTARVWRLALITWGLSCVFFEFLGPFNLLGEPLLLVALELGFWGVAALVEAIVIVALMNRAMTERAPGDPRTREADPDGTYTAAA